MRIKICKADRIFSFYIRSRDKWTCQRCFTTYPEGATGLHCSHYHSRKKESIRFDPENCDALCAGCHIYFGGNPLDFTLWKLKRMGKSRFDALTVRANQYQKKDRELEYLKIRALLDEVEL